MNKAAIALSVVSVVKERVKKKKIVNLSNSLTINY